VLPCRCPKSRRRCGRWSRDQLMLFQADIRRQQGVAHQPTACGSDSPRPLDLSPRRKEVVTGSSLTKSLSSANASSIAEAIAGIAASRPPSPHPLIPNSVRGDGVSTWSARSGPMPTYQRFGSNNHENRKDRWKPAIELNEEPEVVVRETSPAFRLRRNTTN